jgi:hypothetical protein
MQKESNVIICKTYTANDSKQSFAKNVWQNNSETRHANRTETRHATSLQKMNDDRTISK